MTAAGDGSRLSSDEGDAETQEDTDRTAFRYSSHHPQPLGVNSLTTNAALRDIFLVHNLGAINAHLHKFEATFSFFTPQVNI